jgi:hypothetical protein
MNAACFDVGQSLGYSAVYERLGREGNFSVFDPSFQNISDVQTDLLADILRDDDLILALDGDECHVLLPNYLLNRSSDRRRCPPQERLRCEGNLSLFDPGLRHIAHLETDLLPDIFGVGDSLFTSATGRSAARRRGR